MSVANGVPLRGGVNFLLDKRKVISEMEAHQKHSNDLDVPSTPNTVVREKLVLVSETELKNLRLTLEAYLRLTPDIVVKKCNHYDERGSRCTACHLALMSSIFDQHIGCREMFSCEFRIVCGDATGEGTKYFCNAHFDSHLQILKQKDGTNWRICKACYPQKVNSPEFQSWFTLSDHYTRNN